ncbi:MAG TPA: polyprenyl synthetase family protein [Candidatus Saccharimonadales bacterium]
MHNENPLLDTELVHKIDADLEQFIKQWQTDQTIGSPEPIDAFGNILLRGGKRLRGVLAVKSYKAFGGKDEQVALGAARVFEIIQTSLLIVDDIADRSMLRRGGPSVHSMLEHYATEHHLKGSSLHYGQVQAMNVAYAGVHKAAYELLQLKVDPETVRRACSRFHENILVTVNGQVDDIYNEVTPNEVTEQNIEDVLKRKSAYYSILSPIELGAQLAGIAELPEELRAYAIHAGCAYQIADDIISTFGREDETGKGHNDDIREGKLTLLTQFGLAHATADQKQLLRTALGNETLTDDMCDAVRACLRETGALEHAKERLTFHKEQALGCLDKAKASTPASLVAYLHDLTEYLVARKA